MSKECEWCHSTNLKRINSSVFWELPDGTRAIEITETPTFTCNDCTMSYQSEQTVKEIEDQLFLINCKLIEKTITFNELMKIPRVLKKNYFDFFS
ncbi:YokU family protein [Neobacillus ginsengisoli]|uniref:YokU family protein n=1 Tax=Neobacillus ginsengisoli TaxID=904295 RepID=A0ABT9XQL4_9BACI|nr:YokU family protein [Neobacillus ginsengisoli]MDQ0197641.1 putative YokU family protein [Neobacillus ginsengisoli]